MPPKPKRRRLECLVCHRTYDSDYRRHHNNVHHPERAKKHQHIPFKDAGAPENPFQVGSNLINTKVTIVAESFISLYSLLND